jgi:hypothetical protein
MLDALLHFPLLHSKANQKAECPGALHPIDSFQSRESPDPVVLCNCSDMLADDIAAESHR